MNRVCRICQGMPNRREGVCCWECGEPSECDEPREVAPLPRPEFVALGTALGMSEPVRTPKPRARCAVSPAHDRPLEFSQPNPYGYEWECSCPDCHDGEPDGETGHMMRLDKAGWGKTPEAALGDYAEQCETTAEELTMKEGT